MILHIYVYIHVCSIIRDNVMYIYIYMLHCHVLCYMHVYMYIYIRYIVTYFILLQYIFSVSLFTLMKGTGVLENYVF